MELNYLGLNLLNGLLRPFSRWTRKRRMRAFIALMGVAEGTAILDLGGQPAFWDQVPFRLKLTILNLPGQLHPVPPTHHDIRYVEGDACEVGDAFSDRTFDIVFSNSVIEHVGAADKRESFAQEVRRLGRSYWVQTPSMWFPIEAHSGMPLWWFLSGQVASLFYRALA